MTFSIWSLITGADSRCSNNYWLLQAYNCNETGLARQVAILITFRAGPIDKIELLYSLKQDLQIWGGSLQPGPVFHGQASLKRCTSKIKPKEFVLSF
jgi:hypothetical protein